MRVPAKKKGMIMNRMTKAMKRMFKKLGAAFVEAMEAYGEALMKSNGSWAA